MAAASLTPVSFIPPCPATVRGNPCLIGTDANGKLIAYPSGSNVVVRSLVDNAAPSIFFTEHSAAVTCARVSPAGNQCASGDQAGNLFIWHINDKHKFNTQAYQPLSGAIKDIAWSHDAERIAVVGEGRETCGVVLNSSMGTTLGKLSGHAKYISTVDFRKDRPFRIVTGSADSNVNFYEGPPFVFKHSTAGHHGTVNCVRFSPDNKLVASVSGASSLIIQDAVTGEKIKDFPTGHTGTIYALTWLSAALIATASADKSIRVTNVGDGSGVLCVPMGTDLGAMQLGIASVQGGFVSVGLNGRLSHLDSQGNTVRILEGLSQTVKGIAVIKNSAVAVSGDGRALTWELLDASNKTAVIQSAECDFVKTVHTQGTKMYLASAEKIFQIDVASRTISSFIDAKSVTSLSTLKPDILALLSSSGLNLYRNSELVHTHVFAQSGFRPVCAASSAAAIAVATANTIHVFQYDGAALQVGPVIQPSSATHQGDISAIAVSCDGRFIATGDATKNVAVWDASNGAVAFDKLVFHSSRINCLMFGPEPQPLMLASGSLDRSLIVWDLEHQRRFVAHNAHHNGVTAMAWTNANELLSGGADFCVRQWRFSL